MYVTWERNISLSDDCSTMCLRLYNLEPMVVQPWNGDYRILHQYYTRNGTEQDDADGTQLIYSVTDESKEE